MQALATNSLVQKYTKHGLFETDSPSPLVKGKRADDDKSKYYVKVTHWYLESVLAERFKSTTQSNVVGRRVLGVLQGSNIASSEFRRGDWVIVETSNKQQGLFVREIVVDQSRIVKADPSQILASAIPASTIHDVLRVMSQMETDRVTSKWISLS